MTVGLGQLDLLEPLDRAMGGERAEVLDAGPTDRHRARLGAQPRAVAHRAGAQRHVLLDLLARGLGVGLLVAALEVRDDPVEARRVRAPAPEAVAVGDLHALARPVQEQRALVLGELLPGRVEVNPVAL